MALLLHRESTDTSSALILPLLQPGHSHHVFLSLMPPAVLQILHVATTQALESGMLGLLKMHKTIY